jgi:hypothetical protein
MPFDDAVDLGVAELTAATARRLRPGRRIVVSLSGGLDSRAVACALPRDARPLAAVTQGVRTGSEYRLAQRVAERLEMIHEPLDPYRSPPSDMAPLIAWRTEGEVSLRAGLGSAHHDVIRSHGDFIAGGWFGECVSGNAIHPAMLLPLSEAAFVNWCYFNSFIYDWSTLQRVFSANFLARNRGRLRACFQSSWNIAEGEHLIDRYHNWFSTNRAVRMTNGSMPVDSHLFEKIRPFYDRRWIESMAGIPWQFRIGKAFYKSMIYRLGPEVRTVPDSTYGHLNCDGRARNMAHYIEQLSSRAVGRLRRRLVRRTALNTPAEGLVDPALMVRRDTRLRASLESFISGPDCDGNIFNAQGLLKLLRDHYERNVDHSTLILLLATILRALEDFAYASPSSPPDDLFPPPLS